MTGDEQTWMSILHDKGYRCVSLGKTHEVHAGSTHVQTYGGDSFGQQRDWDLFHPEASPERGENYFDILASRQACSAMRVLNDGDEPFALFLGLHAPHPPSLCPKSTWTFAGQRNPVRQSGEIQKEVPEGLKTDPCFVKVRGGINIERNSTFNMTFFLLQTS